MLPDPINLTKISDAVHVKNTAFVTQNFSAYLISDRRYLISCVIAAIAENSFVWFLLW